MRSHAALYELDEAALAAAKPDLILTQELCRVCAVGYEQVNEVARRLEGEVTVLSLEPVSVEGIFNAIQAVGAMTEAEDAALDVVEDLRERLRHVNEIVGGRRDGGFVPPRVAAIEWLDPPVRRAATGSPSRSASPGAGSCSAPRAARASRRLWAAVREVDPEIVVLMPCGFDLARTVEEWDRLPKPEGWADLRAVREGARVRDRRLRLLLPARPADHGRHRAARRAHRPGRVRRDVAGRELGARRLAAAPRTPMPFRDRFDCLWCGAAHVTRTSDDLEGWAQLCPTCLGKAGGNPFLRTRLRTALAERGRASTVAAPVTSPRGRRGDGLATAPASSAAPRPSASARAPRPAMPAFPDDWFLRRGLYERGAIHDTAWAAELDVVDPLARRAAARRPRRRARRRDRVLLPAARGQGRAPRRATRTGPRSTSPASGSSPTGCSAHLHVADPWATARRIGSADGLVASLPRRPRPRRRAGPGRRDAPRPAPDRRPPGPHRPPARRGRRPAGGHRLDVARARPARGRARARGLRGHRARDRRAASSARRRRRR